jgi:hypothetical protein
MTRDAWDIVDDDLAKLGKALDQLNKRGIPFAIKAALSAAAFDTAKQGKTEARNMMTLRNKWTEGSMAYNGVPRKEWDVGRMKSEAGSMQEYMKKQEEGFTERSKGQHGVPVPTSFAANEYKQIPRKRLVRKPNKMSKIRLAKATVRGGFKSKKQEITRHAQEAVNTGRRFVVIRVNNHLGLWRIKGGRKVKRGWPKGAQFRLVYSMEDKAINVKSRQWLSKAAARASESIPDRIRENLNQQIDRAIQRAGLSGGGQAAGVKKGSQLSLL